ncbi:MAG: hypothetical protein AAF789_02435 [Bacteroidota bacterium]
MLESSINQKNRTRTLLFLMIISIVGKAQAQESKMEFEPFNTVHVLAQTEAIAFPFTRYFPIHPGFEIGTQLASKQKIRSHRSWHIYLGGFFHEEVDLNFYVRGEYQFCYSLGQKFDFFIPVGLGYLHGFHPAPIYEQKSDGSFSKVTQFGRPHALGMVGIAFRHEISPSLKAIVRQDLGLQSPFYVTIPVMLRSFFRVGVTYKLD